MSDGVEDQGAEEALLWGQERVVTSVLEAVSRASGSAFSQQMDAAVLHSTGCRLGTSLRAEP